MIYKLIIIISVVLLHCSKNPVDVDSDYKKKELFDRHTIIHMEQDYSGNFWAISKDSLFYIQKEVDSITKDRLIPCQSFLDQMVGADSSEKFTLAKNKDQKVYLISKSGVLDLLSKDSTTLLYSTNSSADGFFIKSKSRIDFFAYGSGKLYTYTYNTDNGQVINDTISYPVDMASDSLKYYYSTEDYKGLIYTDVDSDINITVDDSLVYELFPGSSEVTMYDPYPYLNNRIMLDFKITKDIEVSFNYDSYWGDSVPLDYKIEMALCEIDTESVSFLQFYTFYLGDDSIKNKRFTPIYKDSEELWIHISDSFYKKCAYDDSLDYHWPICRLWFSNKYESIELYPFNVFCFANNGDELFYNEPTQEFAKYKKSGELILVDPEKL